MYKLLLSWRYLRTRYLALASIISVMLGVATLIVVNSVMGGFSTKLRDRMRGVQADVLIESRSQDGFHDLDGKIRRVHELVGDKVEAVSPVIETFALMQFRYKRFGESITRYVRLYGIDPGSRFKVGEFSEHLLNSENRANPAGCFTLQGEAAKNHEKYYSTTEEMDSGLRAAGFEDAQTRDSRPETLTPNEPPPPDPPTVPEDMKIYGVVVGHGIATFRHPDAKLDDPNKDVHILEPGDEILLMTASRSELDGHDGSRGHPRPVVARFVVTDLYKCNMSEYDANMVFIDIKDMQQLRTMQKRATCLQIKLKDYDRDAKEVVETLSKARDFHPSMCLVQTWEHKQGPLLAAISIERGLLNVLLFLIIAVAGFGILAIFFMIVVEKTRDIGILKALGASNKGVMGIFLGYGLALGLVGAGLGSILGVAITVYINEIEQLLAHMTGQEVFPRDIYYFDKIPTDMQMVSVLLVNLGAVLIAVAASVFPSLRAALLHPVRALRYE